MFELTDTMKGWAAITAIGLTVPTYWIYFSKIRSRQAKPHPLSWAMLASLTMTAAVLQLTSKGAGWGVVPTFLAAVAGYTIAIWAKRLGYTRSITRLDVVCVALAVVGWVIWITADQPKVAVIAISVASVLAFFPTIRKSWAAPYDEPWSKYAVSTVRYLASTLAVKDYMMVTVLYPGLWVGVNAFVVAFLLIRRHYVAAEVPASVRQEVQVIHLYTSDQRDRIETAYYTPCCGGPHWDLPAEAVTDDWRKVTCNNLAERWVALGAA
jgi:hypothetical protein